MASEGPTLPGTGAQDTTIGSVAWSDYTSFLVEAGTSNAALNVQTAYYAKGTNFGFSIPTDATIDGIVYEKRVSKYFAGTDVFDGTGSNNNGVRLVKGGTISGDSKGNTTAWTMVQATHTHGSSSDLWGLTWTAANINASNFGAVQSCKQTAGGAGGTGQLSWMKITVYYTEVAGGGHREYPRGAMRGSSRGVL